MDLHMERLLAQHKQISEVSKRVLEINPDHPLIGHLSNRVDASDDIADSALLLLDQARILEGEPLKNPVEFANRMSRIMTQATAS